MIGYGDLATAALALLALLALRRHLPLAIALVWVCVSVGMLDTVNAIIQSIRFSVFTYPLGVNWVIVTMYVPALLVSSLLIFLQLLGPNRSATTSGTRRVTPPDRSAEDVDPVAHEAGPGRERDDHQRDAAQPGDDRGWSRCRLPATC